MSHTASLPEELACPFCGRRVFLAREKGTGRRGVWEYRRVLASMRCPAWWWDGERMRPQADRQLGHTPHNCRYVRMPGAPMD